MGGKFHKFSSSFPWDRGLGPSEWKRVWVSSPPTCTPPVVLFLPFPLTCSPPIFLMERHVPQLWRLIHQHGWGRKCLHLPWLIIGLEEILFISAIDYCLLLTLKEFGCLFMIARSFCSSNSSFGQESLPETLSVHFLDLANFWSLFPRQQFSNVCRPKRQKRGKERSENRHEPLTSELTQERNISWKSRARKGRFGKGVGRLEHFVSRRTFLSFFEQIFTSLDRKPALPFWNIILLLRGYQTEVGCKVFASLITRTKKWKRFFFARKPIFSTHSWTESSASENSPGMLIGITASIGSIGTHNGNLVP